MRLKATVSATLYIMVCEIVPSLNLRLSNLMIIGMVCLVSEYGSHFSAPYFRIDISLVKVSHASS